jgi:DNA-binding CsgD family transcriptional regulator
LSNPEVTGRKAIFEGKLRDRYLVLAVFLVQGVCSVFFVSDILMSVFDVRAAPISWQSKELLEVGASIGLILGVCLGAIALRRTLKKTRHVEAKLRAASGVFMDMLDENFDVWGLTPAERDVALFAIKGLSTAEIAAMRSTSEGTIKAQTNAIYRKAGVSGRPQLLSLFIEDLMDHRRPVRQPAA